MSDNNEPKLAKPGDGISLLEMLILNLYFKPFVMSGLSLTKAVSNLEEGKAQIDQLVRALSVEQLTKRVLVKRPYFVEDSSRYWSAAMLCNHIVKVNGALAKAIESGFTAEPGPLYKPKERLRAVKPDIDRNLPGEVETFSQSVDRIVSAIHGKSENDLRGKSIPHPWFGKLSHIQWVWFAGFHMKIHAKQLEQIKAGLRFLS